MAVAWDSQFSPIDNRSLTLAQVRGDAVGPFFALDRAMTGKAPAATLTQWSQAVLAAYIRKFGAELLGHP
jgi:predicted aconitase with swiveling domain